MSLAGAAAALGLPEALVQRSAEARAEETGASVEDILSAWAGGGPVEATAPATAAPEPEPTEAAEPEPEAAIEVPVTAIPEPAVAGAPAGGRAPLPPQVTPAEAVNLPDVITVPTAGIRERTDFRMPRWLTSLLVVAPLFALFALGGSATGACGEATELMTDVVTGDIVNCDGSEFTGQAVGGGGPDFIAMGQAIYSGSQVVGVNCASCHGGDGQGVGTFPALTGVLTTFSACTDHIEWVSLGSQGFSSAGRGTYGDTAKPVTVGMPSFASSLSAEQIAAVSAFERVRFGGGDPGAALAGCGLVEEASDTEEPPTEGEG